jgi:hypothetical protein
VAVACVPVKKMLVGAAAGNITKIDEVAVLAANVIRVSFVDIDGRLWSSMTCLKV